MKMCSIKQSGELLLPLPRCFSLGSEGSSAPGSCPKPHLALRVCVFHPDSSAGWLTHPPGGKYPPLPRRKEEKAETDAENSSVEIKIIREGEEGGTTATERGKEIRDTKSFRVALAVKKTPGQW